MRSLGGFVLLAGIGVGLFVYLPAPVDSDTSLDNIRHLSVARASESRAIKSARPGTLRTFSPPIPLTMDEKPKVIAKREAPRVRRASSTATASVKTVALTSSQPATLAGWETVARTTSGAMAPKARLTSLQPSDPSSRYKLVVEIQRQLKRARCYFGRIDGSWGAGSKYAMSLFTQRINAALPVEEPDYVLLTLLQANSAKTCGTCPAGQAFSAAGRCVPHAILAQETHNANGGDRRLAETSYGTLPWKTAVVTAPAPRPAVRRPFTPVGTSIISTRTLPGRMAIGGPNTLPTVPSARTDGMPAVPGDTWETEIGGTEIRAAALQEADGLATAVPRAPSPGVKETRSDSPKRYRRSRSRVTRGTPNYYMMQSLGGLY